VTPEPLANAPAVILLWGAVLAACVYPVWATRRAYQEAALAWDSETRTYHLHPSAHVRLIWWWDALLIDVFGGSRDEDHLTRWHAYVTACAARAKDDALRARYGLLPARRDVDRPPSPPDEPSYF